MLNLIVLDRLLHLALIFELFRLCLLLEISDHLEAIVDSIELILKHDHTFKIDLKYQLSSLYLFSGEMVMEWMAENRILSVVLEGNIDQVEGLEKYNRGEFSTKQRKNW